MRFNEYETWFQNEYQKIQLEPGCVEVGPICTPTLNNKAPWNLDWCVRFPDAKHFKVKERWWPRPIKYGGLGYRRHFAFHYGESNPLLDVDGFPVRDANFATIIRIDSDIYNPHLHFGGSDHIPQDKVKGLNLSDAELFTFVKAVMQSRQSGDDFDKIMQFQVIP